MRVCSSRRDSERSSRCRFRSKAKSAARSNDIPTNSAVFARIVLEPKRRKDGRLLSARNACMMAAVQLSRAHHTSRDHLLPCQADEVLAFCDKLCVSTDPVIALCRRGAKFFVSQVEKSNRSRHVIAMYEINGLENGPPHHAAHCQRRMAVTKCQNVCNARCGSRKE